MLSDYQQKIVWEGMLGAETRAQYFARMSSLFQKYQKILTWTNLVLTSSATLALLATMPDCYKWIPKVLALFATIGSTWLLVSRYERNAMGMTELHRRWNTLALKYRTLWANCYEEDAQARLDEAQKEEVAISAESVAFPNNRSLMKESQLNVQMLHRDVEQKKADA